MNPFLRRMAACAVALTLPAAALAAFPERAVTVVVGFPPGTGPDIVARTVGQHMSSALGQSVVIDNKAGAGGQIAAQSVARQPADGYTILLGEVGSMGIAPAAYKSLNYDPVKDFTPITQAVRADFVLVVPASSEYKSVADLVAAAKAGSNPLNVGTFGAGTPGHFGAELFAGEAGIKIEPVHYRTTGDAITGLVSANVQASFVTTALAAAQVEGGKLRALAVTGNQRSTALPDVPTFTEAGLPKVDFSAWFAYFAPAGTPGDVLDTLQAGVAKALQAPEAQKTLQGAGFVLVGSSRADMAELLERDSARWAEVVKATGFIME